MDVGEAPEGPTQQVPLSCPSLVHQNVVTGDFQYIRPPERGSRSVPSVDRGHVSPWPELDVSLSQRVPRTWMAS